MTKITFRKIIKAVLVGLALAALILAIGVKTASQIKPKASGEKLKIEYTINKSAETQTVFSALKDLSQRKNFELKYNNNYSFGVFVESIAGVPNGKDGKYWQYYVNGNLGEVAADKKEVRAGDKVEWRFEKADF